MTGCLYRFMYRPGARGQLVVSKIESDVTLGLAAADQQIASPAARLGPAVGDGARNQPCLAGIDNSGAARPAHRHIARLG